MFDLSINPNWIVHSKLTVHETSVTFFSLQVNPRFAIDFIRADPVVICKARGVWSDSGGPLGHPKVYINLVSDFFFEFFASSRIFFQDKPGIHSCGYSGRKFIQKKYYDANEHGPSITYEEYLAQVRNKDDFAYDSSHATPYQ